MATLNQVLNDIASFINQDPSLVTGTDLTSQVNLINQAQNEWGEAYQWKQLRSTYTPTFSLSGTSLALPSTFKKLMSPVYDVSLTSANQYEEIRPEERFYKGPSDKYVYLAGNDAAGRAIVINPALSSGVSLNVDIQSYPSSVATLQDILTCPSRPFIVARTIAKILAARSDERFPIFKAESDDLLANMIEEEAAPSGGEDGGVPNYYQKKQFRIGA